MRLILEIYGIYVCFTRHRAQYVLPKLNLAHFSHTTCREINSFENVDYTYMNGYYILCYNYQYYSQFNVDKLS